MNLFMSHAEEMDGEDGEMVIGFCVRKRTEEETDSSPSKLVIHGLIAQSLAKSFKGHKNCRHILHSL